MSEQGQDPARPRRSRRWWWIGGGVALVLLIGAALVFQPWLLFVDVRVDDEIPTVAEATAEPDGGNAAASDPPMPAPSGTAAPAEQAVPAGPVELSSGEFTSHEHETTGTARVIELPDGRRQLAIESLDTSSGPDVHVWLSAGPVIEGFDGWFTAASYDHVDLGPIKGNQGDQLYDIPDEVDLGAYPTVDLWCVQFAVSFGAAPLAATS